MLHCCDDTPLLYLKDGDEVEEQPLGLTDSDTAVEATLVAAVTTPPKADTGRG